MLNVLLFEVTIMPYVFWGTVILGVVGCSIFVYVKEKKISNQVWKFKEQSKAEKTKYYD